MSIEYTVSQNGLRIDTQFVCETDIAFGIVKMLQTLHEVTNPRHDVGVVRSESDIENEIGRIYKIWNTGCS